MEEVEAWKCAADCPVGELNRQSGASRSTKGKPRRSAVPGNGYGMVHTGTEYEDSGGSSRFFPTFQYIAKPSRAERNAGLDETNDHPTCKSLKLMQWLLRLITPQGGLVIDPFMGSGTTGCAAVLEGFNFLGCDEDLHHCETARKRITHWSTK